MKEFFYISRDSVQFFREREDDGVEDYRGVALGCALYIGPNRFELVRLLLTKGAHANSTSWNGTTHLIAQCANEDADPEVLDLLLSCENVDVNARIRGKTLKWKGLYVEVPVVL